MASRRRGAPRRRRTRAHLGRTDGGPVVGDPLSDGPALAQVALDIEALRVSNPEVAAKWRRAVAPPSAMPCTTTATSPRPTRDAWYLLEPA